MSCKKIGSLLFQDLFIPSYILQKIGKGNLIHLPTQWGLDSWIDELTWKVFLFWIFFTPASCLLAEFRITLLLDQFGFPQTSQNVYYLKHWLNTDFNVSGKGKHKIYRTFLNAPGSETI